MIESIKMKATLEMLFALTKKQGFEEVITIENEGDQLCSLSRSGGKSVYLPIYALYLEFDLIFSRTGWSQSEGYLKFKGHRGRKYCN